MKLSYLDTSAAMKLVVADPESAALVEGLTADRTLVASWLLHTEMHCAAGRYPSEVDIGNVQDVLDAVNLADLTRGDMITAGTFAPLRSNDAGIEALIRLGCEVVGERLDPLLHGATLFG